MRSRPAQSIVLLVLLGLALGGCSKQTATFPGHSDPEVWNAMVTVAENPVYDDWHVFENEIAADRTRGRIEIFRILRRDLVRVGQDPIRQEEDWRFQVQFLYSDPPTIQFTARQASIPAHLWREADRYFDDMRQILLPSAVAAVETEIPEEIEVETETVETVEPSAESTEVLEDLLDTDSP
ncbi:MAG: hypothetical protein VX672_08770 [Planctomycetota bacterium]|nr:hypothetical protein [Planctomycetota bacterium]